MHILGNFVSNFDGLLPGRLLPRKKEISAMAREQTAKMCLKLDGGKEAIQKRVVSKRNRIFFEFFDMANIGRHTVKRHNSFVLIQKEASFHFVPVVLVTKSKLGNLRFVVK